MQSNRKIKERYYYALKIRTVSPLSISNGTNDNSDSDVFINFNNEVVVPGTSLAGSFRNYLDQYYDDNKKSLFGYSYRTYENNQSKTISIMSSIYISDLYLKKVNISLRDNVRLNDDRTSDKGAKFDIEIVEPDAEGTIFINYLVRENENANEFCEFINNIVYGINNGLIRLGKKKNRGFGVLHVDKVLIADFGPSSVDNFIKFKTDIKNLENYSAPPVDEFVQKNNKYEKMSINFSIPGGLIIKEYSANSGVADCSNIKSNGKPIISGSSFAGLIRHRSKRILREIGFSNDYCDSLINRWFGFVKEDTKKDEEKAKQSDIIIFESYINEGKELLRIRNSIDRFTNATVDGALFSENVNFGGNVELKILVKKDINGEYLAIIGLLSLVIEDMGKGYAPIGGETNIGYGILNADIKKLLLNKHVNMEDCRKKLCELKEIENARKN